MTSFNLVISPLAIVDEIEVVERKGACHPDTICDALAEELSHNLCREYQRRTGRVLHHNVDKALLCGGQAAPALGGGRVTEPIRIFLAGRAVSTIGSEVIPVRDIAVEGSRAWLAANLHALDTEQHIRIEAMVQQGSQDLQALFSRSEKMPLANDTSFGVGSAPLSPLQRLVLAIEMRLHGRDRNSDRPAWGEDIKIMAVRTRERLDLTIACAMIGRYLDGVGSYVDHKAALAALASETAREYGFSECSVAVNAADDVKAGNLYLTVTGTSAEAGDDGQVGRGNRVNGLITPLLPMSLEAAAGKNPVSHVGKIYNVLAGRIAEAIIASIPEVSEALCLIVSRIGAPVCRPALVHLKLATRGVPAERLRAETAALVSEHLQRIEDLSRELVAGKVQLY